MARGKTRGAAAASAAKGASSAAGQAGSAVAAGAAAAAGKDISPGVAEPGVVTPDAPLADAPPVAPPIDAAFENLEQAEEVLEEILGEESATPSDSLAQARAEADEARDRLARLQAEWDNFRKRTAAERAQERARASEGLVERLLPVVDDLERAIEHSETSSAAALKEGIAAVLSKLTEVLVREGVKTIDPAGEAFDANSHQAVGKEDDSSVPDETVTQVYQKGYEMGGRVLRTAMVVVSQGGPKRPAEEADNEG
jgi:molecular chaperone GrpE